MASVSRPSPWFRLSVGVAMLAALAPGCGNPCQQICNEMADYANSCGLDVGPEDVTECVDRFAKSELEEGSTQACAENNSRAQIREWWTCEDLAENFTNSAD